MEATTTSLTTTLPEIDQQKVAELRQLFNADPTIRSIVQGILNYLPDCEYELISFMVQQKAWNNDPVPPPPPDYKPGDGTVEFGLFLYWMNNPVLIINTLMKYFTIDQVIIILAAIAALDYELPPSQMTAGNGAFFDNNELIYTDGGVLSTQRYATYDQLWLVAFLNLLQTIATPNWYNGGTFPETPPPTVKLVGTKPATISIALLGDCGTGDDTLAAIMNQISGLNPDYIVHVGDVYYSGTPLSSTIYFSPGEEATNLLARWPAAYNGRSFTLNSNHEMYSGANGYFYDALGAAAPFGAQKGSSCFALQCGDWTILGLDSAFMGTSLDAFMSGSLGDSNSTQSLWIQKLNLNAQKTIVLTHHNGLATDCSSVQSLWYQVQGALKADPYAWYWGHVHNGIVYKSPIAIPQSAFKTSTYCRCLGHAALPYGPASLPTAYIDWVANSKQPAPSKQLYNGFAILTVSLDNANQVARINESFYDLSTSNAVWTKDIYSKS